MLTPEQARRIGVTYATRRSGALEKEVRTVGQITYDETRVQTIAPKIDGWVERLFVNATGQPVSVGQPLFTIYSPMLVSAQEELLLAKRLEHDVSAESADAQQNASDLLVSARRRLAYWDIPASEIAEIERTGQVQRTLTLRSSASGYVLEKNVVAGQKIMAGDALYRVADLSTVWVEGEVFEQDLADGARRPDSARGLRGAARRAPHGAHLVHLSDGQSRYAHRARARRAAQRRHAAQAGHVRHPPHRRHRARRACSRCRATRCSRRASGTSCSSAKRAAPRAA